jgi:hypothetical protein
MTFKDTMSHFALEDLNSKYDDLIKNPNGKPDYTSPASLDTNFQTKKRKDLNVEDHEDFEIQRTGSQIQLIHA